MSRITSLTNQLRINQFRQMIFKIPQNIIPFSYQIPPRQTNGLLRYKILIFMHNIRQADIQLQYFFILTLIHLHSQLKIIETISTLSLTPTQLIFNINISFTMDQMRRLLNLRYLKTNTKKIEAKPNKINIIPVKVDFPLPDKIDGIEHRLNLKGSYELPEHFLKKNKPQHLVGKTLRLAYLMEHWEEYVDKVVTVVGWARQARSAVKNTILFIGLVDGSNNVPLQVVVEQTIPNWEDFKYAKKDYSFKFTGKVEKSIGKGQTIELKLKGQAFEQALIYGTNDDDKYPLNSKKISVETLRDIAHLRPRTQLISAITRVKNNLAYATHQFYQNNGFLYIHTPIITGADCEGAGEMFQVSTILPESGLIKDIPQIDGKIDYSQQFFKKSTGLTVSGQLAVENYSCALSNVYTFGPTFRAEVSHTSRHAAQFWMIEPELAFADVYDVMECAQSYVKFCIKFILENSRQDLEFFDQRKPGHLKYLEKLIEGPFARASYTEAIDILLKCIEKGVSFEYPVEWGIDLASEHEKYLCDFIFHKPVILYNYPKDIKAFYMRQNKDDKTVAAFDVLAPEVGQIIGGSQREERYQVLLDRIEQLKLPKENYWWYLDLRKHGTVPHGGFGLGFERLIMMCTGIENIREALCFPRTPGNAEF